MNSPIVSVCVPVYNGEAFIHDCIQSVLNQTFEDFELLVVDNASTDSTMAICSSISDRRLRLHRGVSNIGSLANFKRCFNLARGELVILLPCDDLLEPYSLATLAPPLIANPDVGLAFGSATIINGSGEILSHTCFFDSGFLKQGNALSFIADSFNPIQHPLVSKKFYFEQGGFKKKYGCFSDIALWLAITYSCKTIYLAPSSTTRIRQHSEQGQNIIRNINSSNISSVASHFGKRSLKSFQYRYSYNICFLRFIDLWQRKDAKYRTSDDNIRKILSKLVCSNTNGFLRALLRHDLDQLLLELAVFNRVKSFLKGRSFLVMYSRALVLLLIGLPARARRLVNDAR